MEENERNTGKLTAKKRTGPAAARRGADRRSPVGLRCTAYQEFEFHTYSGLPYSYHMKYGRSGTYTKELWINRREKAKVLSGAPSGVHIRKCWNYSRRSERPVVERPKALGDIRGITYIYGIFYEFALLEMPEKAKEKIAHADSRTKNAGKINFQPMQVLTTTHWVI